MAALISELFGRHETALVIGGGPSAGLELPVLRDQIKPDVILSANDHGMHQSHFNVDYLVNCDKQHMMLRMPMKDHLRQYGKAIINKHSWADVRLGDWDFHGNSGLTAVAVAATLCKTVYVTGIDLWATGRQYFHEPVGKPSRQMSLGHVAGVSARGRQQMAPLTRWCAGVKVIAMSGPVKEAFADPPRQHFTTPSYTVKHVGEPVYLCIVNTSFHWSTQDVCARDSLVALTEAEFKTRRDKVRIVETYLANRGTLALNLQSKK